MKRFKLNQKIMEVKALSMYFYVMECPDCHKILKYGEDKRDLPKYVICNNKKCNH